MSDININKLRKQQQERNKNKEKCFDVIKNMCLKKIELASKTGKTNSVLFKIPLIMFGYPSYKLESCAKYLIEKIEKRGFKTLLFSQRELIIFWNLDE